MRLKAEQIHRHLAENFLPLYLVSGDEPLLVMETCDQIRNAAKAKGFTERELLHGDKKDGEVLSLSSSTMSLFAELKLFEFRLPKVPMLELKKAIVAWCESPIDEQCILISCPKLDKKALNADWYKQLEKLGAHIVISSIDVKSLPHWITLRAKKKGLVLEPEALDVLAERVEGNLLAAQQEIDRLSLLYADSEAISANMMREYVGDNARFDSFELLEASFLGDAKRLTRILTGLKLEGEAIAKINGLLTFELRKLTKMAWECHQGGSPNRVLQSYHLWGNKKEGYSQSLGRYSVGVWQRLLARCLEIDKMIKGQKKGEPWMAMESVLLQISGNGLWKSLG